MIAISYMCSNDTYGICIETHAQTRQDVTFTIYSCSWVDITRRR